MRFDISSHGPLIGRTRLPGDLNLTLSVMALGMLSPEPVTIVNPSPSPDVAEFRKFLERYGAEFHDSRGSFSLQGKLWDNDLTIGDEVPDAVIHIVISGAVFSGRTVRILNGAKERTSIIRHLFDVLKNTGLTNGHITEEENDITIKGTAFVPNAGVKVRSARAFEVIGASALASRTSVTISYPVQVVSHSVRLLRLLGYQSTPPEDVRGYDGELARRLAKATGEPPMEMRRFEWAGKPHKSMQIPGDTCLAASVAGTAAVIPKSDVIIENILWEQGRRGFFDTLRRMKGNVSSGQVRRENSFDSADIRIRWGNLEGIHLTSEQAHALSTEVMILGAVAAFARGETVISDIMNGPGLERDAFITLARGLEMFGIHVGDYADGIVIEGGDELRGDLVDSGGRPDIALALAVVGLNASGTTTVFGFEENTYPISEFRKIVKELS